MYAQNIHNMFLLYHLLFGYLQQFRNYGVFFQVSSTILDKDKRNHTMPSWIPEGWSRTTEKAGIRYILYVLRMHV